MFHWVLSNRNIQHDPEHRDRSDPYVWALLCLNQSFISPMAVMTVTLRCEVFRECRVEYLEVQ
jgi:hypothetical protein